MRRDAIGCAGSIIVSEGERPLLTMRCAQVHLW
jgi:hypothetical protein